MNTPDQKAASSSVDEANVSPSSVTKAEQEVEDLTRQVESLARQIAAEIEKLVTHVRQLDNEDVEAAGYGLYEGSNNKARMYADEIATLKGEKVVCNTCFSHLFLFYLSSMTHSQHVCVGVAIVGTGDAQCETTLLLFCCFWCCTLFCTQTGNVGAPEDCA